MYQLFEFGVGQIQQVYCTQEYVYSDQGGFKINF